MTEDGKELKHHCAACKGHVSYPSHARGQKVHCPHCGSAMVLGELETPNETSPVPKPVPVPVANPLPTNSPNANDAGNDSSEASPPGSVTPTVVPTPIPIPVPVPSGASSGPSGDPPQTTARKPGASGNNKAKKRKKSGSVNAQSRPQPLVWVVAGVVLVLVSALAFIFTRSGETARGTDEERQDFNALVKRMAYDLGRAENHVINNLSGMARDATENPAFPHRYSSLLLELANPYDGGVNSLDQLTLKTESVRGLRRQVNDLYRLKFSIFTNAHDAMIGETSVAFSPRYEAVHERLMDLAHRERQVWAALVDFQTAQGIDYLDPVVTNSPARHEIASPLIIQVMDSKRDVFARQDCVAAKGKILEGLAKWLATRMDSQNDLRLNPELLSDPTLLGHFAESKMPRCPVGGEFTHHPTRIFVCAKHDRGGANLGAPTAGDSWPLLLSGLPAPPEPKFQPSAVPDVGGSNNISVGGKDSEMVFMNRDGAVLRVDGRLQPKVALTNLSDADLMAIGRTPKFQAGMNKFKGSGRNPRFAAKLEAHLDTLWKLQGSPRERIMTRQLIFHAMNRVNYATSQANQYAFATGWSVGAEAEQYETYLETADDLLVELRILERDAAMSGSRSAQRKVTRFDEQGVEILKKELAKVDQKSRETSTYAGIATKFALEARYYLQLLNRAGIKIDVDGPWPRFPQLAMTNWLSQPVAAVERSRAIESRARRVKAKLNEFANIMTADGPGLAVRSQGDARIAEGISLRYAFDGDLRDSGPAGNHAAGPVRSYSTDRNGEHDGALNVNMNNRYVVSTDGKGLPRGRSDFTVSLWIRPGVLRGEPVKGDPFRLLFATERSNEFQLGLWNQDKPNDRAQLQFYFAGRNRPAVVTPDILWSRQKWTHLAVVRRGSTLRLHVNGKLMAEASAQGSLSAMSRLWIGQRNNGDHQYLGHLDEILIYQRALNTVELRQLAGNAVTQPVSTAP